MEDYDKEYHSILLGALLHDIGKLFIQPKGKSKEHPKVGADFVARYKEVISQAEFDYELVDCLIRYHHQHKNIENQYHKIIIEIMSCADRCSAGERTKKVKNSGPDQGPNQRYRPLVSLFAHINLNLGDCQGKENDTWKPEAYCHYPKKLDWKQIFPDKYTPLRELTKDKREESKQDIERRYRELQEQLKAELEELFQTAVSQIPDVKKQRQCILTSLYSLLYKYFWTVPDDVGRPRLDISLFDHTRITAALTAAIYLYHRNQNTLYDLKDTNHQQETILLIKGDLSGIQDYIFNIANIGIGGVAKRLRSRSFFLSNLVKVISHRILHETIPGTQLPIFCKIIASGGNFIIVAPNLEVVRKQLALIDRSINEWLFYEFQGDLSCSMAWLPVKIPDLELDPDRDAPEPSRIAKKLIELNELLEEKKQQKLSTWLITQENQQLSWNEKAFVWKYKSFPYGLCSSCKKNPAMSDPGTATHPEDSFCKRCNDDRRFSETFVKPPKYIAFIREKPPASGPGSKAFKGYSFFDGPGNSGSAYFAVLAEGPKDIPADSYLVLCMHPDDLLFQHPSYLQPQANYVSRFKDRGALDQFCNKYCEKTKTECDYYKCIMGTTEDCPDSIKANFPAVKPFDCLARSVGEKSEKLLGILKADVDWMGMLFSHGLGKEASLSRIATLSRMIDLFFSGWLTEFLREEKEFQDTYTVYAGGDDLLIVSSWEKVDSLAAAIAEKFREYVARNPEITISAGIAVTKPKFPIAKSANIADVNLNKAKETSVCIDGLSTIPSLLACKNGLHLFGVTTKWFKRCSKDITDKTLRTWTDRFQSGIEQNVLSKSVTYKLLRLSEMARHWWQEEEKNIEDLRYIALTSYIIGRDIEGNNPGPEKKEMAEYLRNMLSDEENKRIFARFRLPITRALLANRRDR